MPKRDVSNGELVIRTAVEGPGGTPTLLITTTKLPAEGNAIHDRYYTRKIDMIDGFEVERCETKHPHHARIAHQRMMLSESDRLFRVREVQQPQSK